MTQQPTLGWILKGRSHTLNYILPLISRGSTSKQAVGCPRCPRSPHFSTSIPVHQRKGDFRPPPLDRYQAHIPSQALPLVLIRFQRARRCCPDFPGSHSPDADMKRNVKVKSMCKRNIQNGMAVKEDLYCLGGQCHRTAEPTKNLNTLQTNDQFLIKHLSHLLLFLLVGTR